MGAKVKHYKKLKDLDLTKTSEQQISDAKGTVREASSKSKPVHSKSDYTPSHDVAAASPANARPDLTANSPDDYAWKPTAFEEDESERLEHRVARIEQVLNLQSQREAESNKENLSGASERGEHTAAHQVMTQVTFPSAKPRFIDPQSNAERVNFESEAESIPQKGDEDTNHSNEIDEIRSDEGYQQNNQPLVEHYVAHDGPSQKSKVNSKSKSVKAGSSLATKIQRVSSRENDATREQAPEPSQISNYKLVQTQAKLITAFPQPKRVQVRKAWTEEETSTLIDLIGQYGTSWKVLKDYDDKHNKVLHHRDQGGLKDKARNIKVDYLK